VRELKRTLLLKLGSFGSRRAYLFEHFHLEQNHQPVIVPCWWFHPPQPATGVLLLAGCVFREAGLSMRGLCPQAT